MAQQARLVSEVHCVAGEPTDDQLQMIRTRKPEAPVIEVEMGDGSKKKLWCTFGAQQIDIDPFSKPGRASGLFPFGFLADDGPVQQPVSCHGKPLAGMAA